MWIYQFYDNDAKNSEAMRQAVDDLFAMTQQQKQEIYEAIRHDMEFANDTSVNFSFQTIELDGKAQKIIHDVFLYFHKERFHAEAGFALEGLTENPFGRKEFAAKYFEGKYKNNRFICPVCLMQTTNAQKEHDVEHYFPKAFIPCLALHPDNLYFTCKSCNQIYKKEKNHLDEGDANIREIFLPYADTVRDKVKIKFHQETGQDKILLKPADPNEPYIEEKIKTFNYFFELEERWSGMLPRYHQTMSCHYEAQDLNAGNMSEEDVLHQKMEDDLRTDKKCIMSVPEDYVKTHYLEWICQNDSQFKAFYSNLAQKGREPVIV